MDGQSRGCIKIGTIRNVVLFVHWSVPLGAIVVSALAGLQLHQIAYYSLGYLCLIVLHESAHAFAARFFGLRVFSIKISSLGGLCYFERPRRISHNLLIYSAGLLAQTVLLLAAILYLYLRDVSANDFEQCLLASFTVVNAILIGCSLVPFKGSNGIATDGLMLRQLFRHAMWGYPHPHPRIEVLPADQAVVFPPKTCLLSIPKLVPIGFDHGIEVLNDKTTPMDFVVATFVRNLERTHEEAIQWMATIHNQGGILIRLPTLKWAEGVAEAITMESAEAGYQLICRAVDSQQTHTC